MEVDDSFETEVHRSPFSHLRSSGNLNPFSLLDPNFTRRLISGEIDMTIREPFVSHPREVREIPIEVKDGTDRADQSGAALAIEEITGSVHSHGPEVEGIVTIDDDNNDEDVSTAPTMHLRSNIMGNADVPDYSNDIEEEMMRAAIEASKKDAEMNEPLDNQSVSLPQQTQFDAEDPEIAHAVSLSLKTAEQEKALRELEEGDVKLEPGSSNSVRKEELQKMVSANGRKSRLEIGSSSVHDEVEDVEDHSLVRQRRRRTSPELVEAINGIEEVNSSLPTSPREDDQHVQQNRRDFHSDQWGGISSVEHDEAVMLEAAMFGGIPEGSTYPIPFPSHQLLYNGSNSSVGPYSRPAPRPPSPSLTAQRLLREQQDDEYLASLQADKEKEVKAKEEEEAVLVEERIKEVESRRKIEEDQELERQLAAKETSLPQEPALGDENAVTLLIRMPDGSRRGRRFLKSDKLQCLFDFIDVGRVIKPGTYKVIIPYPRRAFSDGESSLTLNELGLTSKQEALFLELI
ncbi:hypothetical protein Leryth_024038 [Lithospermum erythrorhizon]|nr:hypothetical protein Leryth_024038 [Lithospermum erythrorhizon]